MNPMTTLKESSYSFSSDSDQLKQAWEDVVNQHRLPSHTVREEVLQSWIQCRDSGMDPYVVNSLPMLSKREFSQLSFLHRDLIEIANPVMQMLEISVRGTGFIVTLAEKRGYVLQALGDKKALHMARKSHYTPGCLRSSEHAGTNAIGLCIEHEKPIQLTGAEHYNHHHHPWTCSSAPIHNNSQELIGTITLSGPSSARHKHTLALVTAAANTIELQLRERILIESTQRLNSMLSSIYNSISDGFIAIDTNQKVTHLNQTAAKMLDFKMDSIVGKELEAVVVTDDKLMDNLKAGQTIEATEINFNSSGGVQTFLCRANPILAPSFKLLGMLLILSEKGQVMTIAKKIGGNYAKYEFQDIQGGNQLLKQQVELARVAAKTNSRVLIIGESGTGKELFAQAIHNHSNRRKGPFVAISCAAIPRDLIESELFGYVGGAFTGARRNGMIGKFELANNGTLFLDEINGLPLDLQGKLLRVLQMNQIMRLGDTQTAAIDVRIIAASNADLMAEVEAGSFREDLYYRLNVVEIIVPPLRQRLDDIALLMNHIVDQQCQRLKINRPAISAEVIKIMRAYHWPGNVRELENAMERALLLCKDEVIEIEHIPMRFRETLVDKQRPMKTINDGYKEMIQAALRQCDGNTSKAARKLNIARSTLYRKMDEFGISKSVAYSGF